MKKRIPVLLLVICLMVALAAPAYAAGSTYKVEVIVQPQYEDVGGFGDDGLAAVKQNGKWGYINETGAMVISPQFDFAGYFNEGVAVVAKIESVQYFGYADASDAYVFYLINTSGTPTPLMRTAYDFETDSDIMIPNYYYVDSLYNQGITIESVASNWYCNDGAIIVNDYPYTASGALIEPKGTHIFDDEYDIGFNAIGVSSNGVIPMRALPMYTSGYAQCFLMDLNGNITKVFPPTYYEPGEIAITYIWGVDKDANRVIVEYGGYKSNDWEYSYSYGATDMDGNWKVQPTYSSFRYFTSGTFFCDGFWTVTDSNGKHGAVDANGNVVIPLEYDFMGSFNEGMAQVSKDGKMYYIDQKGNTYQIELPNGRGTVTAASHFTDGVAAVYDKVSGKAYCIQNTPVNGVLPLIEGTDSLGVSAYFPDYVPGEEFTEGFIRGVGEIISIKENGKWGFAKLNIDVVEHNNPFTDVIPGDFFYHPVLWAVENGITSGTSATTFSPSANCTREQVVTFLWRAMGEPEPTITENPFTDVVEGEYYYKAVLWAVENGVTSGTSETTFSPKQPCTRDQVVTFLWRAEGEPDVGGSIVFTDVDGNAYYADAVKWAVANNITSGTSATTFSPGASCQRGQIVTFLYRDLAE